MVEPAMPMNEKPLIYIFHLRRNEGRPVFYHPFLATGNFIGQVGGSVIVGRYGEEPRVESVTLLRNDLYRRAETAINLWIMELRFIPRFLLSSTVFLLVYFFMSYAIRDPIPILDELLFGFGGAAAAYFLLGRRYRNSDLAVEKRIEMRTAIDGVAFSESEFVRRIENLLVSYDEAPPEELLRIYGSQDKLALDPAWQPEALALRGYLEMIFSGKELRFFRKKLQNRVNLAAEKPMERLKKLVADVKIDFPLFVAYTVLQRSL